MRRRASRVSLAWAAPAAFAALAALPPSCAARPRPSGPPAASKPTAGEPARQTTAAVSEKQAAAEAAVDRAKRRFYETLDFGTLWRESYVSDERLRRLEVEAITFSYLDHAAGETISHGARERTYVALGNYWHTLAGARFTNPASTEKLSIEMKEPYESFTQRGKPAANERELQEHFTGKLETLAKIFQKYVRPGEYDSRAHRDEVEKWAGGRTEPARPERIREVFAPAGLPKEAEIYVVGREFFYYYLIEEKGEFKILTILNRRRL